MTFACGNQRKKKFSRALKSHLNYMSLVIIARSSVASDGLFPKKEVGCNQKNSDSLQLLVEKFIVYMLKYSPISMGSKIKG